MPLKLRITTVNQQRKVKLSEQVLAKLELALEIGMDLAYEGVKGEDDSSLAFHICVSFLGQEAMTKLNQEQRNINQLTDVLSFPSFEFQEGYLDQNLEAYDFENPLDSEREIFLGDIIISPLKAEIQAEELGQSLEREIIFLAVHGLLHLLGYDHEKEVAEETMLALQREIMSDIEEAESDVLDQWNSWQEEKSAWRLELDQHDSLPDVHKSGLIALIGRANVGKSTLLNYINGQEIAITTYKPQTTRDLIRAVVYEQDSQMIFIDAPGIHKEKHALDRYMTRSITTAMDEADIICLLIDARYKPRVEQAEARVAEFAINRGKALFLLINKVDIASKDNILPLIAEFSKKYDFDAIIPLSGLTGDGVDILYQEIAKHLPERPALFSESDYTNQTEAELASELIRQQILLKMQEEIPHGTAVVIDSFQEDESNSKRRIFIQATIVTERQNHKGMILGKGGSRIKEIRKAAEKRIGEVLEARCSLELYVAVKDGWRNHPRALEDLGYDIKEVEID